MAGLRIHTVMPIELVARIDNARMLENMNLPEGERVSRGEFIRRAVERQLEMDAFMREQNTLKVSGLPEGHTMTGPHLPSSGQPRVRSSAAARPFRPAPKKGKA